MRACVRAICMQKTNRGKEFNDVRPEHLLVFSACCVENPLANDHGLHMKHARDYLQCVNTSQKFWARHPGKSQ